MKLYFSGLNSMSEGPMLTAAGVSHILVDWKDLDKIPADFTGKLALDSGAYRAHKKGESITLAEYDAIIQTHQHRLDWAAGRDEFANPEHTFTRQRHDMAHSTVPKIPVWQWGGPMEHLHFWLEHAPVIAIGGLVPLMREKHEPTLGALRDLCAAHPQRFHLFGLNWLKAMTELKDTALSCDTSKWLDGARYGHLIFIHTKSGKLQQAPAKFLGHADYDRATRCIESARAMELYLNQDTGHTPEPVTRPQRSYTLRPFTPPPTRKPVRSLALLHAQNMQRKRHEEAKERIIDEREWKRRA